MNNTVLKTENLSVIYDKFQALKPCSLNFKAGSVTALIGPSGCGKSTFLRSLNLMNREIDACKVTGRVIYEDENINHAKTDVYELRKHIGMVFQQPVPFQMSIERNILFAPQRYHMTANRAEEKELVENVLRRAALWDEVHNRLNESALALSGGQQQRLCIARALAMSPSVLLLDEPCSALDPASTQIIESTIKELARQGICVIVVTHNLEQARRIADHVAFFCMGEMVENAQANMFFEHPHDKRLKGYLSGRFG